MNDEIRDKVREIIASSMRVALEEVTLDKPLVDLGAESIDFIDIMVGIEHGFDVEFCDEGLFAKLEELFGEDVLAVDGQLTALGARVLQLRRPEIDGASFHEGLDVDQLGALVTAETWARGVQELLEARPTACGSCGSAKVQPAKGAKLRCEDCGATTPCPSQAAVLEAWHARFTSEHPTA